MSRVAKRFSIGLNRKEWEKLGRALALFYHTSPRASVWDQLTFQERNQFIRKAVLAVSSAALRQGQVVLPMACDLRAETMEERSERLGPDQPPDNVLWFRF